MRKFFLKIYLCTFLIFPIFCYADLFGPDLKSASMNNISLGDTEEQIIFQNSRKPDWIDNYQEIKNQKQLSYMYSKKFDTLASSTIVYFLEKNKLSEIFCLDLFLGANQGISGIEHYKTGICEIEIKTGKLLKLKDHKVDETLFLRGFIREEDIKQAIGNPKYEKIWNDYALSNKDSDVKYASYPNRNLVIRYSKNQNGPFLSGIILSNDPTTLKLEKQFFTKIWMLPISNVFRKKE
jgi:hypothetical protein